MEGLDVLHYAIKSLITSLFYYFIQFFDITNNVIYFTIYDKLMLSRKLKMYENNFLIDLDQLTKSGYNIEGFS